VTASPRRRLVPFPMCQVMAIVKTLRNPVRLPLRVPVDKSLKLRISHQLRSIRNSQSPPNVSASPAQTIRAQLLK
jgi:hypothetical protein